LNKKGDVVASAVTNLDIHDIARLGRTYGLKHYYIVTPLEDQKKLVLKIVEHWTKYKGGEVNPDRKEALSIVKIKDQLDDVVKDISAEDKELCIVTTTASAENSAVSFYDMRKKIDTDNKHYLFLFGTAWGLSDEVLKRSDYVLESIEGGGDYNHLSVRSAVSIIIDRLLGDRY